jgi:carbon monoxide dehydrogenase subunit G
VQRHLEPDSVDLNHSVTVPASTTEAWDAFNQIESMAECFPGAAVTSVEGNTFKGTVKVKLGPISMVYAGTGTFLERDESAGRFVVEARGKDKRGNGTAGATVTATISDAGGGEAKVDVLTDLQITGKPAQFGRGVIQDVSDKLLQQFVSCLQSKVGAGSGEASDGSLAAPAEPTSTDAAGAFVPEPTPTARPDARASAAAPAGQAARPASVTVDDDALDLGATMGPALLRSYRKQLAGGAAVLAASVVLWRLSKRG